MSSIHLLYPKANLDWFTAVFVCMCVRYVVPLQIMKNTVVYTEIKFKLALFATSIEMSHSSARIVKFAKRSVSEYGNKRVKVRNACISIKTNLS